MSCCPPSYWRYCGTGGGSLVLNTGFFLATFRHLFLEQLQKAFDGGALGFFASLAPLSDPQAFAKYLAGTRKNEWVVYAKPPFGGPKQVLDYLGRYTHRVAISNNRLLDIDNGKVRFRWKDYRHGSAKGVMTLDADEFIRRFLLHVVPPGLMRILHYGFLANRHCEANLACCRRLLGVPAPIDPVPVTLAEDIPVGGQDYRDRYEQLTGNSLRLCPHCRKGHMVCIDLFSPGALPRAPPKLEERNVERC